MGKQEVKTRQGERIAIVAGLRTPFARQSTEFSQVRLLIWAKWW